MILCVSNDIDCVATFYIYKLCDICESKGDTFEYGLTTFKLPVATLITFLRLRRGLFVVVAPILLLPFPLFCCAFFFFVFVVYLASACFGYFDLVVGIYLHSRVLCVIIITFFSFIYNKNLIWVPRIDILST